MSHSSILRADAIWTGEEKLIIGLRQNPQHYVLHKNHTLHGFRSKAIEEADS